MSHKCTSNLLLVLQWQHKVCKKVLKLTTVSSIVYSIKYSYCNCISVDIPVYYTFYYTQLSIGTTCWILLIIVVLGKRKHVIYGIMVICKLNMSGQSTLRLGFSSVHCNQIWNHLWFNTRFNEPDSLVMSVWLEHYFVRCESTAIYMICTRLGSKHFGLVRFLLLYMSAILFPRKNPACRGHDSCADVELHDVILNASTNHVDDMKDENSDSDEQKADLSRFSTCEFLRAKLICYCLNWKELIKKLLSASRKRVRQKIRVWRPTLSAREDAGR